LVLAILAADFFELDDLREAILRRRELRHAERRSACALRRECEQGTGGEQLRCASSYRRHGASSAAIANSNEQNAMPVAGPSLQACETMIRVAPDPASTIRPSQENADEDEKRATTSATALGADATSVGTDVRKAG
jgi:hypothetical protein